MKRALLYIADYGVKVQTMGRHSQEWDLSGLIAGTEQAHLVLLLVHTVLNSSVLISTCYLMREMRIESPVPCSLSQKTAQPSHILTGLSGFFSYFEIILTTFNAARTLFLFRRDSISVTFLRSSFSLAFLFLFATG